MNDKEANQLQKDFEESNKKLRVQLKRKETSKFDKNTWHEYLHDNNIEHSHY